MYITCPATGHDLATLSIDPREHAFVKTVTAMLADPEWLLPFVAAQTQYRETYYALTAAALLEDVWYDALANWVARTAPTTTMLKTPRGVKGAVGDYVFNGRAYSHKSGNGPQDMGVHWDALVAVQGSGKWTSPIPVVYVASGFRRKMGTIKQVSGQWKQGTLRVRSWFDVPPTVPPPGRIPALLRWDPDGTAEVLALWSQEPDFEMVWTVISRQTAAGIPANHLEMFWIPAGKGVVAGDTGLLEVPDRPGVFVFPETLLSDVPTASNNRATTLGWATMGHLMRSSAQLDLWAPLPMWFAAYAPPRPPDLYLALRGEFDRRFSPVK